MKKLIIRCCLFIPILLLMAVVNFVVDPANLFSGDFYVTGMAQILLSGKNVANIGNFDERLLQKRYIEGLHQKKDVIVLGSSRSLSISSAQFPGKNFFNNSVSVATLEDDIAIYQLYVDKGLTPSTIILGIDPWIFNKYYNYLFWETLSNEYWRGVNNLGLGANNYFNNLFNSLGFRKLSQIFSPSYFQESINYLFNHKWKRLSYFATNILESDVPIKAFDGSYIYQNEARLAGIDQVRQKVMRNINNQRIDTGFEHYQNLDPQLVNLFEKFIDSIERQGIELFIYLPPVHPLYYDYLINSEEKYKMILKVQEYLINVGKDKGILILGSYDPSDIPCQENEFLDIYHSKSSCTSKIFININAMNP